MTPLNHLHAIYMTLHLFGATSLSSNAAFFEATSSSCSNIEVTSFKLHVLLCCFSNGCQILYVSLLFLLDNSWFLCNKVIFSIGNSSQWDIHGRIQKDGDRGPVLPWKITSVYRGHLRFWYEPPQKVI